MFTVEGKYNTAHVYQKEENVESSCIFQIRTLMNQPFVAGESIRIMADCHTGKGVCIGYTQTLHSRKVCPSLVGVDIGCGVLVARLGKTIGDFDSLDDVIRKNVPSSTSIHKEPTVDMDFSAYRCADALVERDRLVRSAGTLGGGNHFIEIDTDEEGNYYLAVHTGSRNLGAQIADYYQNRAYENLKDRKVFPVDYKDVLDTCRAQGRENEIGKILTQLKAECAEKPVLFREYAYLEGDGFDDYINDMKLAQEYAENNRRTIAAIILEKWLGKSIGDCEFFETIHNYIDTDSMILRKGSVEAKKGQELIIPINMAVGSIIGEGKSCAEMNYSAPHGAGRLMTRTAAKKDISLDDFRNSMKGIYSTCVSRATLDESPQAYKKLEDITPHIEDTVDVKKIIRPVYNFKAPE